MDCYLVRHGEAKPDSEDAKRPLSDRGRKEVQEAARAAAAKGIRVSEILHSGKLRAKQTAEVLAQTLSPRRGIREIRGLSPQDDPAVARAELETAREPVMLVGHLPHLGRLASLLVAGDPERNVLNLPTAAVVCLSRGDGKWEVKWVRIPEST